MRYSKTQPRSLPTARNPPPGEKSRANGYRTGVRSVGQFVNGVHDAAWMTLRASRFSLEAIASICQHEAGEGGEVVNIICRQGVHER